MHWTDHGRGVHVINETFMGMSSNSEPCAGFVTVDDNGTVCAGFRQCGSGHGTSGLNPKAQPQDVPMELRCARDESLTQWGPPEYICKSQAAWLALCQALSLNVLKKRCCGRPDLLLARAALRPCPPLEGGRPRWRRPLV